ncbi:MAG: tetratricopeptide repeat protein [Candidatus Aminicenantes bacterium]|nr:tetratricopeptide repeat protein [Candidatus Aminicenantes bacterium]
MKKKPQKSKKKKYAKIPSSIKTKAMHQKEKGPQDFPPKKMPSRFASERMNRLIAKLLNGKDFKDVKEANLFIQEHLMGKDPDEVRKLMEYDPVEEAQELAYEALDTEDPYEALELCRKALDIDPDCFDASFLIIQLTARSLSELIKKTEKLLSDEEQKFGREYFEENKGDFWGLVETRPYMRAKHAIINMLLDAEKIPDAIRHAEDMLALNPNDNQGIRDTLLGMYLETGDLEKARKLIDQYPAEYYAVFLWGKVLERCLSGDLKEAVNTFKKAHKRNPYVFDYLVGNKMPDLDAFDFYSPGEESEAVHCLMEIGGAWSKHPEAIDWLKSLK